MTDLDNAWRNFVRYRREKRETFLRETVIPLLYVSAIAALSCECLLQFVYVGAKFAHRGWDAARIEAKK